MRRLLAGGGSETAGRVRIAVEGDGGTRWVSCGMPGGRVCPDFILMPPLPRGGVLANDVQRAGGRSETDVPDDCDSPRSREEPGHHNGF